MNYCTKCESFYKQPGTCNCYAQPQPAYLPAPLPWQPTTTAPWPLIIPYTTIQPNPTGGQAWFTNGATGYSVQAFGQ